MKKLLVILLMISSISAFANLSEFERGFNEGKLSCSNELWSCSVKCPSRWALTQEGFTRAQALKNLINHVWSMEPQCMRIVREPGRADCKTL
ncbi:MAG: hypothetical protein KAQ98_05790 [Bacteriovoracaceae bacterium]|nr:hypothetical protein [Bacteriovoracaceae bacterium]